MSTRKSPTGIRARHARGCTEPAGGRCTCRPSWEAFVYSKRDGRKVRRTFPTLAAARAWRAEASTGIRKGTMRAPSAIALRQAAEDWLAGAEAGSIQTRSGDRYKPSAIRGYRAALDGRLLPELGSVKLGEVTRQDVQDLADRMRAEGLSASTIRNALMPLRAIYRRAMTRGEVAVNPTANLELPAVRGRRERVASPGEAAALLAAVSDRDRALWATALYAGLRCGELMALDWTAVDLASGVIRVDRAWDPKARVYVEPKSRAGRRRVPVVGVLRDLLLEHKLSTRAEGLVFGRDGRKPFDYSSLRARAARAWRLAGLEPIGLHEARHSAASTMIAAGVNAKAITTYLGHSSIQITFDLYGHLMPGSEDEAAGLLDAYLARADTGGRLLIGGGARARG